LRRCRYRQIPWLTDRTVSDGAGRDRTQQIGQHGRNALGRGHFRPNPAEILGIGPGALSKRQKITQTNPNGHGCEDP